MNNPIKVYDCFPFFQELDLLELRLRFLWEKVDYFVIIEDNRLHSGGMKEYIFEKNIKRYAQYLTKIIYLKVRDHPTFRNSWTFENNQRNELRQILDRCSDNDIIMLSDIDEIPNIDAIEYQNIKEDRVYSLIQDYFVFYMDYGYEKNPYWYGGTKICRAALIKNNKLENRFCHFNDISFPYYLNSDSTFTKLRLYQNLRFIKNGGWHLSSFGGYEAARAKFLAASHQEYLDSFVSTPWNEGIEKGIDFQGKGAKLGFFKGKKRPVKLNNLLSEYPQFIGKYKAGTRRSWTTFFDKEVYILRQKVKILLAYLYLRSV